jgi:hypothetical protein
VDWGGSSAHPGPTLVEGGAADRGRAGAQGRQAGCQGVCQASRTFILAPRPPAGSREACFV